MKGFQVGTIYEPPKEARGVLEDVVLRASSKSLNDFVRLLPANLDTLACHSSARETTRIAESGRWVVRVGSKRDAVRERAIERRVDLTALPYPADFFGGAWLGVPKGGLPAPELAEIVRVLRPGGVLALISRADGEEHSIPSPSALSRLALDPAQAFNDVTPQVLIARKGGTDRSTGEDDCAFCPDLRFTFNQMADLPGPAAVLWGDADLFVIPDLSPLIEGHLPPLIEGHLPPLIEGHLLIVTTDHHAHCP